MNRLIIIGNGFDLAHGMKSSYGDFMDWYWRKVVRNIEVSNTGTQYEDDFLEMINKRSIDDQLQLPLRMS